ncbi:MAG TPA: hypothetical protein VF162_15995 [Streptosporangiaceae bacterium]
MKTLSSRRAEHPVAVRGELGPVHVDEVGERALVALQSQFEERPLAVAGAAVHGHHAKASAPLPVGRRAPARDAVAA